MSKTYNLNQMALFTAIASAVSRQAPGLPADNRANVVIQAANMIVEAYAMTDDEYVALGVEPRPIEVDLQPTEEQIAAGIDELGNHVNVCDMTEDERMDAVVFVWQAMIGARAK